jgi:hypothetical protein
MEKETLDMTKLPDISLVNLINETEGLSWRINHDSADGRIPNKGVDDSLMKLRDTRDRAVEEIKKRTGLQTFEQLKNYVSEKLKEQNDTWDRQWAELCTEGSVFKISGGGRFSKDCPHTFETIRLYLPTSGTMGPNQYILSRIHDSNLLRIFDDRAIPYLTKLENVPPQYTGKAKRGVIKSNEDMEKRRIVSAKYDQRANTWRMFSLTGAVFTHCGFNDTFETFQNFNLPNTYRESKNEVILARAYSTPKFVEFTPRDLRSMVLISQTPRYTRIEGNVIYSHELTLN